jgi:hypothetical protein
MVLSLFKSRGVGVGEGLAEADAEGAGVLRAEAAVHPDLKDCRDAIAAAPDDV